MSKRALITGVNGQDGFYLASLLRQKGYEVVGLDKDNEKDSAVRVGDIQDKEFVTAIVKENFDEIYNLAGVTSLMNPWDDPIVLSQVVGQAPLYFLEAIRHYSPHTKFFQASSAEMFGNAEKAPQNELTPLSPLLPYAASKAFAHYMLGLYRKEFGIFAVSGILFNHESPRRGKHFVTRKITSTLAQIKKGEDVVLELGNLEAKRDWSDAEDIVRGMWLSLQYANPEDYVFASGTVYSVRQFVEAAATAVGITIHWEGEAENEIGKDDAGQVVVRINSDFYRPVDVLERRGNSSKAERLLGWKPETSFATLVEKMIQVDLES